ncbi:antitoxin Xre/MbcA/ParS toxin-binding domain-containing protein [Limnobacter humi]|uniref:antitoxin Xre/MbcA/ParS toxin-binding domain-containing protein n=1 Tax=Limnobacter humi TaxID=1778671 RepID=UPI00351C7266
MDLVFPSAFYFTYQPLNPHTHEIFEGKNALQMIETEDGFEMVEDLLTKLRYVFDFHP